MKKRMNFMFALLLSILFLSACGTSEEKIIEAQAKYKELINTHNQVVEAYDAIEDDGLDDELKALSSKIDDFTQYNLYEMTDEEIDILISTMDDLNNSYSSYLKTIGEIRITEEEAVLTKIRFTLFNDTIISFDGLTLMEDGEKDLVTDVLKDSVLRSEQYLAGLTIYRDVDETPWILTLFYTEAETPKEISFTLDNSVLPETDMILRLKYDENGDIYIE